MIKKIITLALIVVTFGAVAQNDSTFKITGDPILRIYTNLHGSLYDGGPSGFEAQRAYIGYAAKVSQDFSAKVVLDIGSIDNESDLLLLKRYAFFKNAYLSYQKENLNMKFGIIPLTQFGLQEKLWGHRYIYPTVADKSHIGSSADIGMSASYAFTPWLDVDLSLANGEGYTCLQNDDSYKFASGVSLKLTQRFLLRLYADFSEKGEMQSTFVTFLAYKIPKKLAIGIENTWRLNDKYIADRERLAFSGYAWWNFTKKWQIFGRYDYVTSSKVGDDEQPWNFESDGEKIITGVEYSPIKQVRLALNFQNWLPKDQEQVKEPFIYFNVGFRL